MSEVDFLDSVLVLGFGEELNQIILQVTLHRFQLLYVGQFTSLPLTSSGFFFQLYLQHQSQIRRILSQLPSKLPAYHGLEWRLDVQVRVSMCMCVIPVILIDNVL